MIYNLFIENNKKMQFESEGRFMTKRLDLTNGDIFQSLLKMALPIMGTAFIQMAYNMTDMFWIGFMGSGAVSAVGIAGFFVWLSNGVVMLSKTGTEIRVAQETGQKNHSSAEEYARSGLHFIFILALIYTIILLVFRGNLIDFFNTRNESVDKMAVEYLIIVAIGMIFTFSNQVFTGIFNGRGDSKTPFYINTVGLVVNMILDPVLIMGIGGFLKLEVKGAAIATVLAQAVVSCIFIYHIKYKHKLFQNFTVFKAINTNIIKDIAKLAGFPAVQSALFTIISMFIARIIAQYGAGAIAAQKIGSQIESITWMTAMGFSVALGAFVGQNYGAKKLDRVLKGYKTAIKIAFVLGIANTVVLYFGAKWLFMIFIRETDTIALGIDYLKILAFSQLFMCVEITCSGVFNGIGKTKPAAITSMIFNLLRIPMALIFSKTEYLGLNGVWWSITISSILKGIIVYIWIEYKLRKEGITENL